MATINNDLNFRAKLDTSEVEQKLDGLNKQTNNSTQSVVGQNITREMQKIVSQLNRFASSIERTSKALGQMNIRLEGKYTIEDKFRAAGYDDVPSGRRTRLPSSAPSASAAVVSEINFRKFSRFAAGRLINQALAEAADYAQQSGNTTLAAVGKSTGNMIQSTTMGYLAGGPSGAVVGAAQGVMTTIADYWIKKAEELKNTLDSIKATDAFIAEFERLRELLKQLKTSSLDELYDLEQEYTRKAADQYITMKELGKTADTKEGAEQYDQAAKEYTKTMQELDRITGRISQLEDEQFDKRLRMTQTEEEEKTRIQREESAKRLLDLEEKARKIEKNIHILNSLREYNTDLQNKVDINNALKNGDIGKQLKYWEDIHSVSKEKYAEAMEKGEGEKALQYKDMMIKASGYVQTLLEGRKEQLENFTNYEAVSNMAGIGGTLGWNFGDSLQEELNKTAKQSLTQLEEINRKLDKLQEANIIQ